MTLAQRNAISAAPGATPEGLTVFDTDTKNLWIFKNSAWQAYLPSPWDASGSDIFNTNTGNVGIGGVPSPTAKLKVHGIFGVANPANTKSLTYDPTSSNDFYFSGGDARITTGAPNSNLILQQFADTKVAIGNITPTQKLDIEGQIRIRGGSPAAGKVLTSSADGTADWQTADNHSHYAQTWTGSALNGFTVENFASADFNVAIRGLANAAFRSKGVFGNSNSITGVGVLGSNSNGTSFYAPADNSGVSGVAGTGTGVFGAGYSGRGVWGISNSVEGVYGSSTTGISILGQKNALITTGSAGVFEVLNATNSSSALVARSIGATALEIDGSLKVNSANVNKPAFIHVATAANIFTNSTSITYPNPLSSDIVMVIPNYTAGTVYNPNPIGVFFTGGKWAVFNQNLVAMPVGVAFNVLVIRQ